MPVQNFTSLLSLFDPGWWRAWSTILGITKTHDLPVVKTDLKYFLLSVENAGNFGFGVTRKINPDFFGKGIDGYTQSSWVHAFFLIGLKVGEMARKLNPSLMDKRKSLRWKNVPDYYPKPNIGGINPNANKYEVVEAKATISITDLERDILGTGEQVIIFFPTWNLEQKVKMALEAYSWVGEPYDVPEIGNYVLPIIPNSKQAKCCSTLVAQIIKTIDDSIINWCKNKKIDIELIPPRDIFKFATDQDYFRLCFQCNFGDILNI